MFSSLYISQKNPTNFCKKITLIVPGNTLHKLHMAQLLKRQRLDLHINLPETIKKPKPGFSTCVFLPFFSTDHDISLPAIECVSDLEKLKVLGSGNGGTVYKVRHKNDQSSVYALKVIHGREERCNYDDDEEDVEKEILGREVEILRWIDSPFVVGCYGVFENPSGEIQVLMEYMDAGSLEDLAKTNKGTLSEAVIANIAHQVLLGLNCLHKNRIVHRDIKPGNLLVNQTMQVKIADFGVSKKLKNAEDRCNMYVGTCAYMSPERFDSETYGYNAFAGDVWGLGLTLMELYIGHHPYAEPSKKADGTDLMWEICFGDSPSLPEDASQTFQDFVSCCLQKDWRKRWTTSQLLSHPFVIGETWKN